MGKLRVRSFVFGFASAIIVLGILSACAFTPKFPYKYYALDAMNYDGTLKGPKPSDDRNLKECQPTEGNKAPCVVLFTPTFLKLKEDHKDLQNQLFECQQGQL